MQGKLGLFGNKEFPVYCCRERGRPGLSQQLAELREAGLIVGRKESKSMLYRLADSRIHDFIGMMHGLFCEGRKTRRTGRSK